MICKNDKQKGTPYTLAAPRLSSVQTTPNQPNHERRRPVVESAALSHGPSSTHFHHIDQAKAPCNHPQQRSDNRDRNEPANEEAKQTAHVTDEADHGDLFAAHVQLDVRIAQIDVKNDQVAACICCYL